jgi:hypothetical protein
MKPVLRVMCPVTRSRKLGGAFSDFASGATSLMSVSHMNSRWLMLLPVACVGWWALGFPPGWGWLVFPFIPSMGVSLGVLITLGTVVVGLYAGLVWLRDNF